MSHPGQFRIKGGGQRGDIARCGIAAFAGGDRQSVDGHRGTGQVPVAQPGQGRADGGGGADDVHGRNAEIGTEFPGRAADRFQGIRPDITGGEFIQRGL